VTQASEQPGVYFLLDGQRQMLYVGKAANLRKRLQSYVQPPERLPPRIARLMGQVADLEVRTTTSEAEALLLESQLIKQHKPKYNVAYRDDKSYPVLRLTAERFPRLVVDRSKHPGSGRVFGPYPDAGAMHAAVQFLRRVFPLRTCRTFPKSPCLEYHLGQCLAPCVGYIDEAAYQRIVEDLAAFLNGRRDGLLKELARRMEQASRHQRFEEAARLRDQIHALTSVIVAKEKSALAGPLEQLQVALKLPVLPRRIEAFDCSNIFGAFAVGSLVTFVDGQPLKAHYRHFKIRTARGISAHSSKVRGGDDYQMMRELVRRRYHGSLSTQLPCPDLILVDGGKGQLRAGLDELRALHRSIPILGLAKRFEHIFVPHRAEPVVLLPTSPVLHLMQHIRDEAHRFAVSYHRRLRNKPISASALDRIPGIGPKRKAALLAHFGSIVRLHQANPHEIAKAARMTPQQAEALLQGLTNEQRRGSGAGTK